ncbi:MAG: hypothetical protein HYW07_03375 [Candidatus Latescibacteria bacterium]|nr:hypothetical protein [Candidatus Latescibacterota bacterium]
MVEALLIVCFLLAFVCVISKSFIGRRLEDHQQRLNEALREVQRTADERRQNEGLLASEEDKERRLRVEYQSLADELAEIKNRLARRASGSTQG